MDFYEIEQETNLKFIEGKENLKDNQKFNFHLYMLVLKKKIKILKIIIKKNLISNIYVNISMKIFLLRNIMMK